MAEAINTCRWDGETPIAPSEGDIFCHRCRKNFEEGEEFIRSFMETVDRKDFKERSEYYDFMVFEALVRLCSPYDGIYYGRPGHLEEILPATSSTIVKAINRLEEAGKLVVLRKRSHSPGLLSTIREPYVRVNRYDEWDWSAEDTKFTVESDTSIEKELQELFEEFKKDVIYS